MSPERHPWKEVLEEFREKTAQRMIELEERFKAEDDAARLAFDLQKALHDDALETLGAALREEIEAVKELAEAALASCRKAENECEEMTKCWRAMVENGEP